MTIKTSNKKKSGKSILRVSNNTVILYQELRKTGTMTILSNTKICQVILGLVGQPVAFSGESVEAIGQPVAISAQPVAFSGRSVASSARPVASSGQPVEAIGDTVADSGRSVAFSARPVAFSGAILS